MENEELKSGLEAQKRKKLLDSMLSPTQNQSASLRAQEEAQGIIPFNGSFEERGREEDGRAIESNSNLTNTQNLTQNPVQANPAMQGVKSENQEGTSLNQSEEGGDFIPTGYKYFDKKIKDNDLNIFDGYIAQKYLGLDLSKHLNVDLNAKIKSMSGTKSMQDLFDIFNTLDIGSNLLANSNSRTGTYEGVLRGLNRATNGFIGINEDRAKFATNAQQYVYGQARAAGSGRLTNQQLEDAKNMYSPSLKSAEQYIAQVGQGQRQALIYLDNKIEEHLQKGFPLSPELIAKRDYYEAQVKAIEANGNKFNQKDFHKAYMANLLKGLQ